MEGQSLLLCSYYFTTPRLVARFNHGSVQENSPVFGTYRLSLISHAITQVLRPSGNHGDVVRHPS